MRQVVRDLLYGLREGYPLCCVVWFTAMFSWDWPVSLNTELIFGPSRPCGYVRCPCHRWFDQVEQAAAWQHWEPPAWPSSKVDTSR